MEDNFIVDMSQLHLSKEDRVIIKTAEKALRELDFTSFRVWLSLVASNGYNPQQIMADYNFTMEQVTHSMEKLEKKGYITPVGEDALIIRHFPEKKEKVILSRNVAAKLVDRGYTLLREEANRRDPTRKVYIFPWSEEIETDLLTVLAERAQYYNK